MKKFYFERNVNQTLFYSILGDIFDDLESLDFENDTFIIREYWKHEDDDLPNLNINHQVLNYGGINIH